MPFTPKAWQDSPATATPLSAAALIDLENRVTAPSVPLVSSLQPLAKFGATGTADDSATFQAAAAAGGQILVPAGSYNVLSQITLSVPVQFLGVGMGKTVLTRPTNTFQWVSGGGSKTTLAASAGVLTANVAAGATVLPITNGAAVSPGDYLNLHSTLAWPGSASGYYGEIVRVLSVATNNVTLYTPTYEAYNTVDGAIVDRINFMPGVRFADLSFISTQNTGTFGALNLSYLKDAEFERVEMAALDNPGIQTNTCLGTLGIGLLTRDLTDNLGASRVGYGINEGGADQDSTWIACKSTRVRHSYTTNGSTDGTPHNCTVLANVAYATTGHGFDTHEDSRFTRFVDCRAVGCGGSSFNVRAPDVELINPMAVRGVSGPDINVGAPTALRCKVRSPIVRFPAHVQRGIYVAADDCSIIDPDVDLGGGTTAECLFTNGVNRTTVLGGVLKNPGSAGATTNTGLGISAGTGHVIDTTVESAATGAYISGTPASSSIKIKARSVSGNVINGTNFNGDQLQAETPGASPWSFTNNRGVPLWMQVTGGTVSAIDRSPGVGAFMSTGVTTGAFMLMPAEVLRVTYSAVPTVNTFPVRQ